MEHNLFLDVLASLQRLFVGYIPAAALGIFVGYFIGINGLVYQLFKRIFQILNNIPAIALLPIALIVFKDSEPATVTLVFLTVLWSIILETATGIQQFRKKDKNFRVAINYIFNALRLGVWIAWVTVIATEMLTGPKGLGSLAWDGYQTGNTTYIIDAILYIAIIGILSDQLLDFTGYILSEMVSDGGKTP